MTEETYTYQLIDWSKPEPATPQQTLSLTVHEAWHLNRGFALNGVTKRWIKQD